MSELPHSVFTELIIQDQTRNILQYSKTFSTVLISKKKPIMFMNLQSRKVPAEVPNGANDVLLTCMCSPKALILETPSIFAKF